MTTFSHGLLQGFAVLALIAAAPAQADTVAPAVFNRCAVCHNASKGGADKIGPNLWGVFGRQAASTAYKYSPALKAAKLKWDAATLDQWISGPMKMVPGTLMAFPGISDPAKRAEIISYLKQLH